MLAVVVSLALLFRVRSEVLQLDPGSGCDALGGERGTCQLLTDCYNPGDFKKNPPPICGFEEKVPVICCPNSLGLKEDDFRIQEPSRVLDYCRDYSIQCEKRKKIEGTPIILQGKTEKQFNHTYLAVIGYGEESQKKWSCGGSLITTRFVLSSARCSEHYLLGPARWAKLGGLELVNHSSNMENSTNDVLIVERIAHPDYSPMTPFNDIALFLLEREVSFNLWLGPVCLHGSRIIPTNMAVETIWAKKFNRNIPDMMVSHRVIMDDEACGTDVVGNLSYLRSSDSKLVFCARSENSTSEVGFRERGGGPLVINIEGQCLMTQIGIASYVIDNDITGSTVYTRISNYLPWIEEIAFPE